MPIAKFFSDFFSSLRRGEQYDFRDGWHSFDNRPWRHPWLTPENLREMAGFSSDILVEARRVAEGLDDRFRFGFVCNIANSMYSTAKALRPLGADIDVIPHPTDSYMMSQPEWEEFDGVAAPGVNSIEQACRDGEFVMPSVDGVVRCPVPTKTPEFRGVSDFAPRKKFAKWRPYYAYEKTIRALRKYDALFAIQAPYLAYLSERPYIATHMGGDIWFECSRDDMLGQIQRAAFSNANLFIASNPWSYSFARRYGMRNFVCVPTLLNPEDYSPGEPELRGEWALQTGGDFFVLTTARADDLFKGSNIALQGFRRFSENHPTARLIMIGWGADLERHAERVNDAGLTGKILILPPAGKKRLIRYLRSAHVLLDQFVLGYFGMTALEALAVGTPVVMRLESEQYQNFLTNAGPPPVVNASDEIGIASTLDVLAENSVFLGSCGEQSRSWFMNYAGYCARRGDYLAILAATAAGHRFDYRRSPLGKPIGKEEHEYHQEQLKKAPQFPSYI